MASQALAFGEFLAAGVLVTMGVTGKNVREVFAGKAKKIEPIAPPAPAGGGPQTAAYYTPAPGQSPSTIRTPHGSATNPLPGWTRSRIDQGVDFYGGTKIVAPEAGRVLKVGAPGWPEGGGVLLKLASGKIVFFYEGLTAMVHPGDRVAAGQQIASGIPGGSIEVGFADAAGVPLAHAGYFEGKVTNAGRKMAKWLTFIGAP